MMLISDTSTQWLEIPDAVHQQSWQQSQSISMPGNRFQAYLNQVCLQTVLPWLQEKSTVAPMVDSTNSLSFWEMVNGSAITLGTTRLIIIPTEAMDRSEFRVPQEWIDIPSWVGDYYLAVEVDSDDQCLNIWGYATHQMLKSEGNYDASDTPNDTLRDRTYCLDGNNLIQDMTVFWVMQQLPGEPTRTEIPALPVLSPAEAETLIQQLGDSTVALPRLEVPFVQWGALLEQPQWFQQLCQQRTQVPTRQIQAPVNLSQWWQNVFEAGWQAIEDLFEPQPELAFNFRQTNATPAQVRRVKPIQLGEEFPAVLLVMIIETEADERIRIGVQIHPQSGEVYLPANLRLELLSITGEVLQSVQAGGMSNYIQLRRFKSPPGTQFRLQVAMASPRPSAYANTFTYEDFIV